MDFVRRRRLERKKVVGKIIRLVNQAEKARKNGKKHMKIVWIDTVEIKKAVIMELKQDGSNCNQHQTTIEHFLNYLKVIDRFMLDRMNKLIFS